VSKVARSARVSDANAASGPLGVAGVRQPLKLGALAHGPASPAQWGVGERPDAGRPREAAAATQGGLCVPRIRPWL
jgi:hypothetical protein